MSNDLSPASAPPVTGGGMPQAEETDPISGFGGAIEALLRRPRGVLHHLHQPRGPALGLVLALIAAAGLAGYGFIVGTYSGGIQLWAAPLKVAGGLLISGLICFPSLFVLACLTGSTARVTEVLGLLAGLLALTAVMMASFAPVAWVFSQSTESVAAMGALHLALWLVATLFGARFLLMGMSRFGTRDPGAFLFWTGLFIIVVLQMTTALRPIVGKADTLLPAEKKLFLRHWADSMR